MTNHDRHGDRWRVERWIPKRPTLHGRWRAVPPTDPCSDANPAFYFDTFVEAMNYAQREAFRSKLLEDFELYLDTVQNPWRLPYHHHNGLDTMYRTFRWWGKYDLADYLENA